MFVLCFPVAALACIWGEKTPMPKPRLPAEHFRPKVDMKLMPPALDITLTAPAVDLALPAAPVKPDSSVETVANPEAEYARIIAEYERNPAAHASFLDRNDYAASAPQATVAPARETPVLRCHRLQTIQCASTIGLVLRVAEHFRV